MDCGSVELVCVYVCPLLGPRRSTTHCHITWSRAGSFSCILDLQTTSKHSAKHGRGAAEAGAHRLKPYLISPMSADQTTMTLLGDFAHLYCCLQCPEDQEPLILNPSALSICDLWYYGLSVDKPRLSTRVATSNSQQELVCRCGCFRLRMFLTAGTRLLVDHIPVRQHAE